MARFVAYSVAFAEYSVGAALLIPSGETTVATFVVVVAVATAAFVVVVVAVVVVVVAVAAAVR